MTAPTEQAWMCKICGYVHRGEQPPECCPACGAATSEFELCEPMAAAPGAAAAWTDVGAADELATRPLHRIEIGETVMALVCKDGEFSAISGVCNHVGGPLAKGRLEGDHVLCPWHQWKYHCRSGKGECGCEGE